MGMGMGMGTGMGNGLRVAAAIIGLAASGPAAPGHAATATGVRTAVVNLSGKLVRSKGAVSSRLVDGSPGFYQVTFKTSVAKCAYFVGLGDNTVFSQPSAFSVGATPSPFDVRTVIVGTFINPSTPANTSFSLLVVC